MELSAFIPAVIQMADAVLLTLVQLTRLLAGGRSLLIIYTTNEMSNVQWISSQLNNLLIPTVVWNSDSALSTELFSANLFRSVLLLSASDAANRSIYSICQQNIHNDFVWIYPILNVEDEDTPLASSKYWKDMKYPQKSIIVKLVNESGCVDITIPTTQVKVGSGGYCTQPLRFDEQLAIQQWTNLGGRAITATTVNRDKVQGVVKINNTVRGHGMIFEILDLMTAPYNFTYNPILSSDNYYGSKLENHSWDGMMGQIIRKDAELTAAVFQITEERSEFVDFSLPIFEEEMMILQRRPTADRSGEGIYKPFRRDVWILLLVTIFVVSVATYALYTAHYIVHPSQLQPAITLGECIWTIIRLLFSQAGNSMSMAINSGRILQTAWGLFVVTVTSMYTANLTAFLTIPNYDIKIKYVKDLETRRNVRWMVKQSAAFISEIESEVATQFSNLFSDLRSGHAIAVPNDIEAVENILVKGYVYLQKETTVLNIMQNDLKSIGECRFAVGYEKFFRTPTSIAFIKGSPYKAIVDDFVLQLKSFGITDHLYSKYYPTGSDTCPLGASADNTQPITFNSFDYTYIILGIGLALGIVVMLFERLCIKKPIRKLIKRLKFSRSFNTQTFKNRLNI